MDIKLNILVVEDTKIAQDSAEKVLKTFNCTVKLASSGAEALALTRHNSYDLIFMDLGLPDIDGLTLIETILDNPKTQNGLPPDVIVLTSHSDKEMETYSQEAGSHYFLPKPITPTAVAAIIQERIAKRQPSEIVE